ncbi:hypothetical protein [Photobacterium sp.]|uniref:hypothetical protein n=1 Tax=Photobacterium sp. TaxID=660 RepID=UPI00299E4B1F|nr:hypothetical protein [Photobacterium sp.]MDX1304385.1 hypothetical protein [Photobacterium sp.]
MNQEISILSWNDKNIPHKLWTEKHGSGTRIFMKVIKDVEPEMLTLELPFKQHIVNESWSGQAMAVSNAFDDGQLFAQTRVLFNLNEGCVIWAVTHIKMPDGNKMSADKLTYVPGMKAYKNKLIAK